MPMTTDRYLTLPDGRLLDLERDRWDGVLDRDEIDHCRRHSIALAYDCAQGGWVPADCRDDGTSARPTTPSPTATAPSEAPRSTVDLVDLTERTLRELIDLTEDQNTEEVAAAGAHLDATATRIADDHGAVTAGRFRDAVRARLFATHTALLEPAPAPEADATPVVEFRRWTEEDVPTFRELLDDPRVWEHLPESHPDPFTDEVARTLIDISRIELHHDATAVVVDGRPVGQCVVRFDDPVGSVRAAEVSYWLGHEHWGRGLMSAVLPRFTARAFALHPDVEVVYAWISPRNPASARVAERSGYHRDTSRIEPMVADSIRRPGWERYTTYRSQW